ncbi:MAG: hypothetical protein KDC61_18940 [Saprospiraceae bacterium]|nr:hypothetical protein [Saprospiraceae bacterium]
MLRSTQLPLKYAFGLVITIFVFISCSPKLANPPASGFNSAGSDAQAVRIADEVMAAMGGRKAWDDTRCISWNFFGSRTLLWDKQAGMCRIEWQKRPLKVIVDLNKGSGKVWIDGAEQSQPDSLAKYLEIGKKVWINDSYWLLMPFKLKDSGVTLKYLGESATDAGTTADLLQLSFQNVGVTPDNKYHVWVDKKTRLVSQWAYFEKFGDEKPRIVNPWSDYKRYGGILIAGSRGESRPPLTPIEVMDAPPPGAFERF